ncbi:class I SAM-dependent methyltransferase [Catellatospora sp. NPDC049133]|jgi:ubiquinone/menaquinone biosynthesis C-methylase UbiE|uniref:class I SAM-dependent methyltransferase n=1 Tax=Catellatospora sp. NPDC049133 TaxID=3155499 RepID=UPI0033E69973
MTAPSDADRALKSKHRAMWALGDYPAVASEVIPELGTVLAKASGAGPGVRVLDVGAGSGNAAIPAALAGADVVASDLTPELFDAGRQVAEQRGAKLSWEQGDAEALPYGDGEFDVVMSSVGVMFAPHHQEAADELVRVCRPGGTIALANWTPQGFIGQMFAVMKPYAAPPPPGAQPPPLWGSEEHVAALFGDRVTDVVAERRTVRVDRFADAEEFRDFFKACYGPTIAVYRNIADQPDKVAALDEELAELGRRNDLGWGAMDWEYLLYTAHRAA